jgi:transposase
MSLWLLMQRSLIIAAGRRVLHLIIAGERGATKLPHHHDESLAKQQAVCLKLEQIAQRAIH